MKLSVLRKRWWMFIVVLFPIASLLSGCSGTGSSSGSTKTPLTLAPMSQMSTEIQQAAVTVSDAYRFALANPEIMKQVPCYCGCGAEGHTSNYSCFVQEIKPTGEIVFDHHALGCSICVDIAQNVMQMTQAGKTPQEIRVKIDQTYSQYGTSNMPSGQ
jgi:Protein of unknown function with PCYCGC motif